MYSIMEMYIVNWKEQPFWIEQDGKNTSVFACLQHFKDIKAIVFVSREYLFGREGHFSELFSSSMLLHEKWNESFYLKNYLR